MKAFSAVTPVLLAVFLAAACGDDDDSTSGPTVTKCKTPYGDQTAASLKAATASAGKCAPDTAAICGNDMISVATSCGIGCQQTETEPALQLSCTQACIKSHASPSPSDDCAGCYVADVACSIQFCLAECLADPTGICVDCRAQNGCAAAFYTCSGLPIPKTAGEGGAGGAPSASGGKANTSGGTASGGQAGAVSVSGGAGGTGSSVTGGTGPGGAGPSATGGEPSANAGAAGGGGTGGA